MKLLNLLVLTLCLGCADPGPWLQQPPARRPKRTPVVTDLKVDVQTISVVRPSGSMANKRTALYIESELRNLRLRVQRQPFSSGVNIIGTQPGQLPTTIIIGSHYDSVPRSPGADDNASGCAMTLLLARQLSRTKLRHTIRYVFFDAEELGLHGSSYYVRTMREKCVFMLNFDMVGCLQASDGVDPVLPGLFQKYPWAKGITFRQKGPTDHAPFHRRGIPVVWLHTGGHNRYHTPADVPSTLNYRGMVKIGQYATELILNFDRRVNTAWIESLPVLP